jgi:hypothetical protein
MSGPCAPKLLTVKTPAVMSSVAPELPLRLFTVTLDELVTVYVPVASRTASSNGPGTVLVLQLSGAFQLPEAAIQ